MTSPDTSAALDPAPPQVTLPAGPSAPAAEARTVELRLGTGRVVIDAEGGHPLQFVDDTAPERTYLLDGTTPWHSLEHAWGTGHVVADSFTARWNAPHSRELGTASVTASHRLGEQMVLDVERAGGDTFPETYRFRNVSQATLRLTGLGIQTPFADLYPGALASLTGCVHAHVFTGGEWSWAAAQPMDGGGRVLGLRLEEGALWSYAVESRNAGTFSNARGHLVLQATDHARAPHSFGGQPVLTLAPGEEHVLSWELAWYEGMDAFLAATRAPAEFSAFSVAVGETITVRSPHPVEAGTGSRWSAGPTGR